MKKNIFFFLLLFGAGILAHATKIKPTDLSILVARADYIVVGKVVKVDMVDANGHEISDLRARTEPHSGKTIRYHVHVERSKTLKGNPQKVPLELTLPDWPMWISEFRDVKVSCEGKQLIFLLKAPDFSPSSWPEFVRGLPEKPEIEKILKTQRKNGKN